MVMVCVVKCFTYFLFLGGDGHFVRCFDWFAVVCCKNPREATRKYASWHFGAEDSFNVRRHCWTCGKFLEIILSFRPCDWRFWIYYLICLFISV